MILYNHHGHKYRLIPRNVQYLYSFNKNCNLLPKCPGAVSAQHFLLGYNFRSQNQHQKMNTPETASKLIRLVYVSKASREMQKAELKALLDQSRKNNSERHLTGMLLYASGSFIQALEGEERDVLEVYEAVQADPRNIGNIVLDQRRITDRLFRNWSMGYHDLSETSPTSDAYSDFLNRDVPMSEFAERRNEVIELLYSFKQHNQR